MVGNEYIHTVIDQGQRVVYFGIRDGEPFNGVGYGARARDILLGKLNHAAEGVRHGARAQRVHRRVFAPAYRSPSRGGPRVVIE